MRAEYRVLGEDKRLGGWWGGESIRKESEGHCLRAHSYLRDGKGWRECGQQDRRAGVTIVTVGQEGQVPRRGPGGGGEAEDRAVEQRQELDCKRWEGR